MWLMTSFGILMPSLRPEKYTPDWDDRKLQIRARRSKDLDILRAEYMKGSLGGTIYTPDKDYEYRAYCTHEAWAIACMKLMMEIDYVKFKPTTDRYRDHRLHSVYNRIWGVVIADLSTKHHRDEYLHSRRPGWTDYKVPSSGAGDLSNWKPSGGTAGYDYDFRDGEYDTTRGSSGKGGTVVGTAGSGAVKGTGWPDDPTPAKVRVFPGPEPKDPRFSDAVALPAGPSDWPDARKPQPVGYPSGNPNGSVYVIGPGDSLEKRSTAADRDTYEPEVWQRGLDPNGLGEDDWQALERVLDALPSSDDGAVPNPLLDGLDVIERAKKEIALLRKALSDPVKHDTCDHNDKQKDRVRCEDAHDFAVQARIDEINKLIDEVENARADRKALAPTG